MLLQASPHGALYKRIRTVKEVDCVGQMLCDFLKFGGRCAIMQNLFVRFNTTSLYIYIYVVQKVNHTIIIIGTQVFSSS